MDSRSECRVLVVGDESSVARAKTVLEAPCTVELTGSLAEAAAKQAAGGYDRVIVDPSALQAASFEVLASPADSRRATDDPASDFTAHRRPLELSECLTALDNVIESIRDNFFCLDRQWRFTRVNAEAERQFRKPRKELIGHDIWELFPEAVGTVYWDYYHRSMADGVATKFQAYYSPHDIWTEVRVYPTEEGIAVFCLDISDMKRVEAQLSQAQEDAERMASQIAALLDAVPALVFITNDPEGKDITGSKAAYELLRLPQSANVSASAPDDERPRNFRAVLEGKEVPPEDLPVQRAARGEEVQNVEIDLVFDDGDVRTIYGNAIPLLEDGEPSGSIGAFIDVTERRRAEEGLRRSRQLLQDIIDNTSSAVYVKDLEGKLIIANRALAESLGRDKDEMIGKTSYDFYPREVAEAHTANDRKVALHGENVSSEEVLPREDGDRIFMSQKFALRAGDGTIYGIAGISTDITEAKRAQDDLRESEERFRSVLDSSLDVIYRANLKTGAFEYISPSCQEVVGYSPEELMNQSAEESLEMIHPDDLSMVRSRLQTDESDIEYRQRTRTGEYRWMSNHARITRDEDGTPLYRDGHIRDITRRKEAEEARQESETRLRQALKAAAAGTWEWDFSTNVSVWSQENYDLFGLDPELGAPDYHRWESLLNADDLPSVRQAIRDAVEGRRPEYRAEFRVQHSELGQRWILALGRLVRADDGTPFRLSGINIDITERKQMEDALAEARNEAERRLAELSTAVSSMTDGILLFNAQRSILMANETAMQLIGAPEGLSYDEWKDKHELYLISGERVTPNDYPSARALRGEETKDARFRMVTPWNTALVNISGAPVRASDGQIVGAVLTIRDITELIAIEDTKDELFRREQRIARVLQDAIMPPSVPSDVVGYRIAATYRPALREAEIGGDFYDVFRLADDKLGILIGDVVGKGLHAALRVASARHAIRSYAYLDPRPGRVITLANEALCRDSQDAMQMLTAFFAVLDPAVSTFTYCSAGHEPPIVRETDGRGLELDTGGLPLGLMSGTHYTQNSRRLEPGEMVVLVTDGITEARRAGVEMFGKQRLIELVETHGRSPIEQLPASIMGAAMEFAGGDLQDDAAVVVFAPRAEGVDE